MIKYLIKNTSEYRIETKAEVDDFHRKVEKCAADEGYTLTSWVETLKERKSKGEVVDSYYSVKYTYVFNDIKEPERPSGDIEFNFMEGEGAF